MSGIFGYINTVRTDSVQRVVRQIGARMCHQAHYIMETIAPNSQVGLGRIGIGIFNRPSQPVHSLDGKVWLCMTGEFYHQEARRAELVQAGLLASEAPDAALALQVYLHEGALGLTQLDGAFTLTVWDERRKELLLVNDRYGLYPHYFAHVGGAFTFAPEIKGVLCAPEPSRKLNEVAIAEYIRFQQLLGDKTWFEDVQTLPPASLLRYDLLENKLSITRYWDWDAIETQSSITFDEAIAESIRLFQRAVNAMTAPPQRIGVYLSGGLDGRIILGFIDQQVSVTTITFGAANCRDVIYARQLARWAGSKHHWFPFHDGQWVREYAPLHLALTEGMHSWMHAHGISTLAEARKLIDVNLSGWDGATTMGGFAILENHEHDRFYRYAPDEITLTQRIYDAFCQELTWPGLTESEAATLLSGGSAARLRWLAFDSLQAELSQTAHYLADRRVDYFYIQQSMRRSLQNQIVLARSAIEVRCPYMDYDFVNFMYSLPDHVRCNPAFRRTIVERRMPHLAMVPYEKDNRLPKNKGLLYHTHTTFQRAKGWINRKVAPIFPQHPRLYADYEQYLRTDLREWAAAILFDRRTQERGFFDPAAMRALWERHQSGAELWTIGKIAPLISLELVMRSLYDEPAPQLQEQAPELVHVLYE